MERNVQKLGRANSAHQFYRAAAKAVEVLDSAVQSSDYIAFAIVASDSITEDPVIAYRLGGDAYSIEPEVIMCTLKEASQDGVLSGAYAATVHGKIYKRDGDYNIISAIGFTQQAWFGVVPLYEDTAVNVGISGLGKRIQEAFNKSVGIDAELEAGSGSFVVANWRKLRYERIKDDILEARYAIMSDAKAIMSRLLRHVEFSMGDQRCNMALIIYERAGDDLFEPTARYLFKGIDNCDTDAKRLELDHIAEESLMAANNIDLGKATENDFANLQAHIFHVVRGGAYESYFDIALVCQAGAKAHVPDEEAACDGINDTLDVALAECSGTVKPEVWDEAGGDYLCRF